MIPNPQQQMQALATRATTLAKTLDERIHTAHELEKSTRDAAHDLERAAVAFERDEEAMIEEAKQMVKNLVAKKII